RRLRPRRGGQGDGAVPPRPAGPCGARLSAYAGTIGPVERCHELESAPRLDRPEPGRVDLLSPEAGPIIARHVGRGPRRAARRGRAGPLDGGGRRHAVFAPPGPRPTAETQNGLATSGGRGRGPRRNHRGATGRGGEVPRYRVLPQNHDT